MSRKITGPSNVANSFLISNFKNKCCDEIQYLNLYQQGESVQDATETEQSVSKKKKMFLKRGEGLARFNGKKPVPKVVKKATSSNKKHNSTSGKHIVSGPVVNRQQQQGSVTRRKQATIAGNKQKQSANTVATDSKGSAVMKVILILIKLFQL